LDRGIQVSSAGVRGAWLRLGLMTKHERLLRLKKATGERKLSPSNEQIRSLERISPSSANSTSRASRAGALVGMDTLFVGHLKGAGKPYPQTAIDCYSRYAWAGLYRNKLPVTAAQLMNNDVLPTFKAWGTRIEAVLSDNGREFCVHEERHSYELFLQFTGIELKRTRIKRPGHPVCTLFVRVID
jgi:hypothetical protein